MKHTLIITHFGSGGTLLCRLLANDLKIKIFGSTKLIYDHPLVIDTACERINSVLNTSPSNDLYIDKLMENHEFACKSLYKICKFIYLVRDPLVPLATLINRGYSSKSAENYYLFRLRRICEMANKTRDAILLTYQDLINRRFFPLIQTFLGLKSPLKESFEPRLGDDTNLSTGRILENPIEPINKVPEDVLKRCEVGYRKYINFLGNCSHFSFEFHSQSL